MEKKIKVDKLSISCMEAQGMITSFIGDTLDSKQLEQFLHHINHCEDCEEELEVYFTLLTGMKQLDEDKNLSPDFHIALRNRIRKAEERVIRNKIDYMKKRVILFSVILVSAFLCSRDSRNSIENKKMIEKSNFQLKYYYFEGKKTKLDKIIEKNYDKLLPYQ